MVRKIKLYIAMSLDGKIAKMNDDVSWLDAIPNPDKSDYGYEAFYENVDAVIMGNGTYKFIQNMDIEYPYKGKSSYVITRDASLEDNEDVKFIQSEAVGDTVSRLKQESKGDIWLVGGGQVNTLLANESLMDEIMIYVMPIVIGEGIPLFGKGLDQKMLNLVSSKSYKSGVVELVYKF
jgi:dihydrofolate reductase